MPTHLLSHTFTTLNTLNISLLLLGIIITVFFIICYKLISCTVHFNPIELELNNNNINLVLVLY